MIILDNISKYYPTKFGQGKSKQDAISAEYQRAEAEQKRLEERLRTLSAGALSSKG